MRTAQNTGTSSRPVSTTVSTTPFTWSLTHSPADWSERPVPAVVDHRRPPLGGQTSSWEMRAKTTPPPRGGRATAAPDTRPSMPGPGRARRRAPGRRRRRPPWRRGRPACGAGRRRQVGQLGLVEEVLVAGRRAGAEGGVGRSPPDRAGGARPSAAPAVVAEGVGLVAGLHDHAGRRSRGWAARPPSGCTRRRRRR